MTAAKQIRRVFAVLIALLTVTTASKAVFPDVSDGEWYSEAIAYVKEANLMNGVSETSFLPEGTLTRGMMVTILYNMEGRPDTDGDHPFSDVDKGVWYAAPVAWAYNSGIVNGYEVDTFAPNDVLDRQQMSVILFRYSTVKGLVDTADIPDLSRYTDADTISDWAKEGVAWAIASGIITGTSQTTISPTMPATRAQTATVVMRYCEKVSSVSAHTDTKPKEEEKKPATGSSSSGGSSHSSSSSSQSSVSVPVVQDTEQSQNNTSLQSIADSLAIGYAAGDYDRSVIHNLTLPASDVENVTVTWSSSNNAVITDSGIVTRQAEDVDVTLTATVSDGIESITSDRTVKVIHMSNTEASQIRSLMIFDLQKQNSGAEADFAVGYNEDHSQITYINGQITNERVASSEDALFALCAVRSVIGMQEPVDELEVAVVNPSEYTTSYTFDQVYNGAPVLGHNVTLVSNKDNESIAVTSDFYASDKLIGLSSDNLIEEDQAQAVVQALYPSDTEIIFDNMVVYTFDEYEDAPVYAYIYTVICSNGIYTVIINAHTGDVICQTNNALALSEYTVMGSSVDEWGVMREFPVSFREGNNAGHAEYSLRDIERNITMYIGGSLLQEFGQRIINTTPNNWDDPTAISAYTNLQYVYDWYKNNCGRISIDGNKKEIKAYVHRKEMTNNAAWMSVLNIFGFFDNDKNNPSTANLPVSLASSIDCIAHEYTHAVNQYKTSHGFNHWHKNYQVGYAIDEAYADIMAWLVDYEDTTLGEDWSVARDISNPNAYGCPDRINGTYWVSDAQKEANGDNFESIYAHTNSGVISHAAYLMSLGFQSKNLPALSRNELIRLWYGSLDFGFNSKSDFNTVRRNVLLQAGAQSLTFDKIKTIKEAFDTVGILGDCGTLKINVSDSETSQPLMGANVSILDQGTEKHSFATSDDDVTLNLATGRYGVTVTKDGYSEFIANIVIDQDDIQELNIILSKDNTPYTFNGMITNAVNGDPIEGAVVTVRQGMNSMSDALDTQSTDTEGEYQFSLTAGVYTIEVQADGFADTSFNAWVSESSEQIVTSLSPLFTNDGFYRAVLTWGLKPRDLDAHLQGCSQKYKNGQQKFHIYFLTEHKNVTDDSDNTVAMLDIDDLYSYGPETITFSVTPNDNLEYFVKWYDWADTDASWADSEACVMLYSGENLIAKFTPPSDSDAFTGGSCWCIFTIKNGIVVPVNKFVESESQTALYSAR